MNFGTVLTAAPSTRLVVWVRTNVVKFAVGIWRAKALIAKCGSNNIRSGKEKKCALPNKVIFPLAEFEERLKQGALFFGVNLGVTYSAALEVGVREVFEVFYEEFCQDKNKVLGKLLEWLGLPELHQEKEKAQWMRVTGSDLRQLLKNYDEIHTFLRKYLPCYLSHLEARGDEVAQPCPNPFVYASNEQPAGKARDAGRKSLPATKGAGLNFEPGRLQKAATETPSCMV